MEQGKLNFSEQEEKELQDKLKEIKVLSNDQKRLAFYALLSAGMTFKEGFFKEDLDTLLNSKSPSASQLRTKGTRQMTEKTARKLHEQSVTAQTNRLRFFHNRAYEELNNTRKFMNADARKGFDGIVAYIVECASELLSAPRHAEVIMLLKMYNAGHLDVLFEKYREGQAIASCVPNTVIHEESVNLQMC